jgi:exosortase H (IPTLxxWG-CTERM-specific)
MCDKPPSDQTSSSTREAISPPCLRFALLCCLFLMASVWLEPDLLPLNRFVAQLCGHLLALCGQTPRLQGELLTLSGFTVRIVLECTAIHPILIYIAFVLSRPGTLKRTLVGLAVGSGVLFTLNIARIALVTVVGARWPLFFEISHVYLGQVVMLLLVLAAALAWLRFSSGGPDPLPFLLLATLWCSLLFLPWVVLNKFYYMKTIDSLVSVIIMVLSPSSGFEITRLQPLYTYTFSLSLYLALVLAKRDASFTRRMACGLMGALAIMGWHLLFRLTHVTINLFDLAELMPLHIAVYLAGQFLIPLLLWFTWFGPSRCLASSATPVTHACKPAVLLLVAVLIYPTAAWAEPLLIVKSTGTNAYQLDLKGLERISRVTIAVEYVLQGATPAPRLIPSGLGAFGSLKIESSGSNGDAHSMKIVYEAAAPLSRDGALGNLRLTDGYTGVARVADLRVSAQMQDIKEQAIDARVEIDVSQDEAEPLKTAATVAVPIKRRSLKGVLEQFLAVEGVRTSEVLAGLVERSGGGEYRQEPPLLIADGVATVRLVLLTSAAYKETPRFAIKGAEFNGFSWLESGELAVDVLPEKGALKANVTIITADEQVDYPLTVAPPLEIFDVSKADPAIADFVRFADGLVRSGVVR